MSERFKRIAYTVHRLKMGVGWSNATYLLKIIDEQNKRIEELSKSERKQISNQG